MAKIQYTVACITRRPINKGEVAGEWDGKHDGLVLVTKPESEAGLGGILYPIEHEQF